MLFIVYFSPVTQITWSLAVFIGKNSVDYRVKITIPCLLLKIENNHPGGE